MMGAGSGTSGTMENSSTGAGVTAATGSTWSQGDLSARWVLAWC